MAAPAAPAPGRRVSFGATAVLVGYVLLAPPLYFLVPFALLSVVVFPRTIRELFWLLLAGAGVASAMAGDAPFGVQLLRASGLGLGGVFVLLSLRARGPFFPRALLAAGLTALGIGLWAWSHGIGWGEVERAFTALLTSGWQTLVDAGGRDAETRRQLQEFVRPLIEAAPRLARVMPGFLTLQALAGTGLAWWWHHRVATAPLGLPPARFREFRFNDQLVWGAIFGLGLLLAPLPREAGIAAANLLVVWAGLYAARGLAIVATVLSPAPASLKLIAAGLAVLLAPVAAGASVTLGLADTWLDIRGRLRPPVPGGA
jgi:predicted membrane protein DUF2232